jgi:hypothetical protein
MLAISLTVPQNFAGREEVDGRKDCRSLLDQFRRISVRRI